MAAAANTPHYDVRSLLEDSCAHSTVFGAVWYAKSRRMEDRSGLRVSKGKDQRFSFLCQ